MSNCRFSGKDWKFTCDKIATTALKRHDGEVVQLCEDHAAFIIQLAKDCEADHWLVLNKIL